MLPSTLTILLTALATILNTSTMSIPGFAAFCCCCCCCLLACLLACCCCCCCWLLAIAVALAAACTVLPAQHNVACTALPAHCCADIAVQALLCKQCVQSIKILLCSALGVLPATRGRNEQYFDWLYTINRSVLVSSSETIFKQLYF